jgi:hypothetical protein
VLCVALICAIHVESTMSTEKTDPEHERWLDAIVSLPEAAFLRGISVDTLRREHKRGTLKILELSPHRRGVTRREALKK